MIYQNKPNAHGPDDLRQMQSMPLKYKILMTKERIEGWYENWTRFEIEDTKTGKRRFVTMDTRDRSEPPMNENEWIASAFPGQVYVSFSGGKDSTVLKHIVDSMYDDVPAVFVNTGLEYPEIQRFVREVQAGKYGCFNPEVEILRPEMRFDEVIKTYGYPVASKLVARYVESARRNPNSMRAKWIRGVEWTKFVTGGKWAFLIDAPFPVSDKCCSVMKHKPVKQYAKRTGRKAIIGTMASESLNREQAWRQNGCNAFAAKTPTSQPLSFWTEQDILHYIKEFDVPYCPAYGEIKIDDDPEYAGQLNIIDFLGAYEPQDRLTTTGCSRTGCMFCMFGCHLEKQPNRFQTMKTTHPRQYEYCIGGGEEVDGKWQPTKDGLGLAKVLDYIGVPYE